MSAATIQKPKIFFSLLNESFIKFGATLEDQIWVSSTKEAIIRLDVIEGMNTVLKCFEHEVTVPDYWSTANKIIINNKHQ